MKNLIKTVGGLFLSILVVLLIIGVADAGSDIKFSIKSKSLGLEKGKDKICINITVDRSADLLYREEHYLNGMYKSEEYRFLFLRYSLESSFVVLRPKDISDIKITLIYKKTTIFEQRINSSNKFKLDYTNINKTNSTKTDISKKTNSTKTDISKKTNSTKTDISKKTNGTKTNITKTDKNLKESPGYGIVTTILAVVVTLVLVKNRKTKKK